MSFEWFDWASFMLGLLIAYGHVFLQTELSERLGLD